MSIEDRLTRALAAEAETVDVDVEGLRARTRERLAAATSFPPSRRLAEALEPSNEPLVVARQLDETDAARAIRLVFQPLLVLWALWSTGVLAAWNARRRRPRE